MEKVQWQWNFCSLSSSWVILDFSSLSWRSFHILFHQIIFGLLAKSSERYCVKRFLVVFWCVHSIFLNGHKTNNQIFGYKTAVNCTSYPLWPGGKSRLFGCILRVGRRGKSPDVSVALVQQGNGRCCSSCTMSFMVPAVAYPWWEEFENRTEVMQLVDIFHVQQFWLWEFLHQVFLLFAALSSWHVASIDACLL